MPDGKTHAFATAAAALATPLLVHGSGLQATPTNTAAATLGCLLGLLITPDLDVNHGCDSMREIRRRLGKPAALAWRSIWLPYAYLVPHRSWVSHFPLIGTALRLGYLYFVYFLFAAAAELLRITALPELHFTLQGMFNSNLLWAFSGLTVADTLHYAMDKTLRN